MDDYQCRVISYSTEYYFYCYTTHKNICTTLLSFPFPTGGCVLATFHNCVTHSPTMRLLPSSAEHSSGLSSTLFASNSLINSVQKRKKCPKRRSFCSLTTFQSKKPESVQPYSRHSFQKIFLTKLRYILQNTTYIHIQLHGVLHLVI